MITELVQQNPRIAIIIMALIVSFFVSLINYFFLDKERMREIKAKQKALREEAKQHHGNPEKLMEINKEIMGQSMEMMRHSFKPMLITIVPILLFFSFMKGLFVNTEIAKTWIWWYIGGSILGSIIFRKILKLP